MEHLLCAKWKVENVPSPLRAWELKSDKLEFQSWHRVAMEHEQIMSL